MITIYVTYFCVRRNSNCDKSKKQRNAILLTSKQFNCLTQNLSFEAMKPDLCIIILDQDVANWFVVEAKLSQDHRNLVRQILSPSSTSNKISSGKKK